MLIIVFGITLVAGKTLTGLNERSLPLSQSTAKHYQNLLARNIAGSGANMAIAKIFNDYSWRNGFDHLSLNDGEVTVNVQEIDFDSASTTTRIKVTAVGAYAGSTATVETILGRLPFSYFAQFTDNWPSTNYYVTGDTLYGPVHTNTRFNFSGTPVFYGKVSSVAQNYGTLGITAPQFSGGTDFGSAAIHLPLNAQELETAALNGGDVYSNSIWLRFNPDGSYDYGNDATYGSGTKQLSTFNGTIMTTNGADVHIKGTLHGQVTIYSGRHIYLEDNMVYAQPPHLYSDSNDMLGLVARNDVIVADNTANRSNIEIHGAIMALNSKFYAQNYNTGSPRGTLTALGSIIQVNRGTRGVFSLVNNVPTVIHGYRSKMLYDERFTHAGPPYFPLVPKVKIFSWLEK
ncbi:MAG: hypothetical protein AAB354_01540 [candidate division KSB1 bacterium]